MLLAIDIGNTSILFGVFRGSKLVKTFRKIVSKNGDSPNCSLKNGVWDSPHFLFDAAIICSVVPRLTPVIAKAVYNLSKVKPLIVVKDIDIPIKNKYKDPKQVGQDRLVDAIAAKEIYGIPAIVVDSGTAITFNFISKKGDYEGGLIVPGIDLSLKAL